MKPELKVLDGGPNCVIEYQPMTSLKEVKIAIQDEVGDKILFNDLHVIKEKRGPQIAKIEEKMAEKISTGNTKKENEVLKELHNTLIDEDPYYKSLYISLILEYQEKREIRA